MGSEWRSDDGVGPAVAGRVAGSGLGGASADCAVIAGLADPFDLLGQWDGADLAVVVDATRSGLAPGTISRIELDGCVVAGGGASSSHGIGLAGVLRLARAVGRAPARVVAIGIEGEHFGQGTALSPAVAAAVDRAAAAVAALVAEVVPCA